MVSLYTLKTFFDTVMLCKDECLHNATERKLSTLTDAELFSLRESAAKLTDYVSQELMGRTVTV